VCELAGVLRQTYSVPAPMHSAALQTKQGGGLEAEGDMVHPLQPREMSG
jgi:hypothetical protein